MNPFKLVLDFWRIGHPDKIADRPSFPDEAMRELNLKLIEEEFKELIIATGQDDIVETADAIVDLIYVTIGMAITHGIPIEEVFAEVHRTNMAKFPGGKVTLNHYGKIMKPEGWQPPDLKSILDRALSRSLDAAVHMKARELFCPEHRSKPPEPEVVLLKDVPAFDKDAEADRLHREADAAWERGDKHTGRKLHEQARKVRRGG